MDHEDGTDSVINVFGTVPMNLENNLEKLDTWKRNGTVQNTACLFFRQFFKSYFSLFFL